MQRATLFQPLDNQDALCQVCQRRCKIPAGKTGHCRTRKNKDGELYSLIYGRVSSIRVSPIEIKPLFHFFPGSQWLSMGSLGCNFLCPGCQNWEIAHADPEKELKNTKFLSPSEAVSLALEHGCKGISWTYNEPTLWLEYTLDCARTAKEKGLLTNYVTNGYITPEALDLLGPYLDAYRVDLKGFSSRTYERIGNLTDFKGILRVVKRAKVRWNMYIEVITNLIPGFNDGESEIRGLAKWIFDDLGAETAWHVTRFMPHLKLSHLPPTPVAKLERAREIGFEQGLNYVYVGNVAGHPAENTYCPGCGKLLIERANYRVIQYRLAGNLCRYCGQEIAGCFAP
jgi:pyruvate formate lyase activating enzyme